jgi:uncharacterized membrane protein YeaQ/YmgE (transglycosylase-associated protein family)
MGIGATSMIGSIIVAFIGAVVLVGAARQTSVTTKHS